MTGWVKKSITDISKCERLFMPLNNRVHWAIAVFEVKKSKIFLFDSMRPRLAFVHEQHLLLMIPKAIYAKIPEKGEWVENWEVVTHPPNVLTQRNGDDCGVFLCVHAALYATKAGTTGEIPPIVNRTPRNWRNLLSTCLATKTLTPFLAAFEADKTLE